MNRKSLSLEKEKVMTTKEDILNSIRQKKPELKQFGVDKIGLFGSYIRNEQNYKSDIDILIDFDPENETFDNFMEVCDILEKLFKSEKVEIVTKNGLSPYIGPVILKEVFYV
jgi:predicted nucleotidyltransferase